MPTGRMRISDVVILPVLSAMVLWAGVRIVHRAYTPETGPLKDLPKELRRVVRALESPDIEARREAAMRLMLISMQSAEDLAPAVPHLLVPAVAHLVGALSDEDDGVREYVGAALARIGPAAVPALVDALTDDESDAALLADVAGVLGEIGPVAREAVPYLKTMARASDERIADAAARALRRIEGTSRRRPRW